MAAIMAIPPGWNDRSKSSTEQHAPDSGSNVLEIGMIGLNLESASDNINSTTRNSRSPLLTSGDSVHSFHSIGSNPGDNFTLGGVNINNNRLGDLGAGLSVQPQPQLIGKPGHTKSVSNSSTAHTATLTPTSSVDGGASNDMYAVGGRQTHSPSATDHLPGMHNLGNSLDTSPGPSGNNMGPATLPREFVPMGVQKGVIQSQQTRPRAISKDSTSRSVSGSSRPPLAGGSALSPHTVDGLSFQTPGSRSRDASPPPNTGVISRPESQFLSFGSSGGGNESFDSSLRRALSNESLGTSDSSTNYSFHRREGSNDSHLSSSFSQLPLNNSQRVGGGSAAGPTLHSQGTYHQSHPRSQSQPGHARNLVGTDYYHEANYEAGFIPHRSNIPESNLEADYSMHMQHQQQQQQLDMRHSSHGVGHQQYPPAPRHGRSMSMQHSSYADESHDMGYGVNRRGSMGARYDGQMQPHREFGGNANDGRLYNERDRIGNANYHRHGERFVSPLNSSMHNPYGSSHSRHHTDMVNTSGHSNGSGMYGNHRLSHSDEDLSRPLAGENIEVPGEDHYYNDGASLPAFQRSQSLGPSPNYGPDSHHLPTAGGSIQTPKIIYNVKFKRTQRTFEIGPRLNRDLPVGTYVKVEADRGEDLGIIIGRARTPIITRTPSFGGGMGEMPPTAGAGGSGDMKKVTRLATHDEVSLLAMKREQEEELLKNCRIKVRQRGMPMHVVDAEYQFDRHKLTFFFEADTRIDFRELVRDLFSIYKTRIWMQQLDKSSTATCPTAPAPSPLVMDYGTPIIAPMSEYEGFTQASGASDDGAGTD